MEIINDSKLVNSSVMKVLKDWIESIAVYMGNIDSKSLISVGTKYITTPRGDNFVQVTQYELGFFRYNGVIVWDWSLSPNSSFTFTPNGSGGYDWEDLKTLLKSF